MTTLLHSISDYMILTIKIFKNIYYKKYDYKIINEFKYILVIQRMIEANNTSH
jgi:hypothetical protein